MPSDLALQWGEWIADMGEWHVFGGLTYDPKRYPHRFDDIHARKHVERWLGNSKGHPGVFVEAAVVALEHHKNGWPHFHPLLRLRGGSTGHELATLGQAWFRDHGYARLEIPRDKLAVSTYAAKYLAKDLDRGDVIFWPPRGPLSTAQPALVEQGVDFLSASGPTKRRG
jgi:hypothetical protein